MAAASLVASRRARQQRFSAAILTGPIPVAVALTILALAATNGPSLAAETNRSVRARVLLSNVPSSAVSTLILAQAGQPGEKGAGAGGGAGGPGGAAGGSGATGTGSGTGGSGGAGSVGGAGGSGGKPGRAGKSGY